MKIARWLALANGGVWLYLSFAMEAPERAIYAVAASFAFIFFAYAGGR